MEDNIYPPDFQIDQATDPISVESQIYTSFSTQQLSARDNEVEKRLRYLDLENNKVYKDYNTHKGEKEKYNKGNYEYKTDIEVYQKEIEKYKKENKEFKNKNDDYKIEIENYKKETENYKKENENYKKQNEEYKKENEEYKKKIEKYKKEYEKYKTAEDMKRRSNNYYTVLGLERSATLEDIKKAYKDLSKTYHPDKNKGNEQETTELFKNIGKAYEILSDEHKRSEFDEELDQEYSSGSTNFKKKDENVKKENQSWQEYSSSGYDFSEFLTILRIPFTCHYCNIGFKYYEEHINEKGHKKKISPYWCDTCEQSFDEENLYMDHLISREHRQKCFPFWCYFCDIGYFEKDAMVHYYCTYYVYDDYDDYSD